jgi:hypothetical protein
MNAFGSGGGVNSNANRRWARDPIVTVRPHIAFDGITTMR